jgi:hypothetical protein
MGLDFSDGTASGQLVRHAIRDGSISEPHLVKWFAKHLASGDVEEALKIFHPSVRQLLLEPALLGAIGLIESENYVQAARIIVAFDLREDFSGDIRRLISNCLEAGKSGVAANLAETLGPSFTVEFHQIVEATVSALLEKQQFNAVAGLLGERRLAFSRHRLVEVLTLRFNSLVKQKRYSDISAFLNSTLCPYLPAGSVASAIGSGPVPISATVSYKRADRYFLLLTFRKDLPNIMLHGSISPRLFPELEVGDRCLVRVEPTERGYRAVFAERSLL